jgi:hypothetical protein
MVAALGVLTLAAVTLGDGLVVTEVGDGELAPLRSLGAAVLELVGVIEGVDDGAVSDWVAEHPPNNPVAEPTRIPRAIVPKKLAALVPLLWAL